VVRGFEEAALLRRGTTGRAIDKFNSWIGPGEQKRIRADIKFALRLGAKHLERVMCQRDAVRPRTIAFVGTPIAPAKLDDEADSGFLSLTMTKRGEKPDTVVLTAP
jgi:hypothetical protein